MFMYNVYLNFCKFLNNLKMITINQSVRNLTLVQKINC